jgi:hypothetical protein
MSRGCLGFEPVEVRLLLEVRNSGPGPRSLREHRASAIDAGSIATSLTAGFNGVLDGENERFWVGPSEESVTRSRRVTAPPSPISRGVPARS